eukprot:363560-Chlamydomonas_euryale.AAC.17
MSPHADSAWRAVFTLLIPHSDHASQRDKDHARAQILGRTKAHHSKGCGGEGCALVGLRPIRVGSGAI